MNQYIGFSQQPLECCVVRRSAQIQTSTALANGDVGHDGGFVPLRRVDTQYIRTEGGQKSGGYWTGQHARQIEHPESLQWP